MNLIYRALVFIAAMLWIVVMLLMGTPVQGQTQAFPNPDPAHLLLDQRTGQYVHVQTGQRFYLRPITQTVPQAPQQNAPSYIAQDVRSATVRIKSHGASATIIATCPGRSWVLGCAHAYEAHGQYTAAAVRAKTHVIDGPYQPYAVKKTAESKLLAWDYDLDLSLLLIENGPFLHTPVAPPGFQPGRVLSLGYDHMNWTPDHAYRATLCTTHTREKPIPGRSGGGLVDADARLLIGVCQGYENIPGGRGMYISHRDILTFLEKNKRFFVAPQGQQVAPQQAQNWQPGPRYNPLDVHQEFFRASPPPYAPPCHS